MYSQLYSQKEKKQCRTRLIKHAVKALTVDRSTSVCVKRDHVSRVWQQLHESGEAQKVFDETTRKKIEKDITDWELLHDRCVRTKKPSDLRVCYLSGDNPINDLEIFVENGVLWQNVWGIEKDSKVLEKAWENVAKSDMTKIHLFKGDLITFLKDTKGEQFDIIYFDACGTLPSAKQKTLKTIGYIFMENKLTSPGALITNFSFPPEENDVTNDSHVSERKSFEHLTKEFYMQFRLRNTHLDHGEDLRAEKIDSQSADDNYGDYITFQVIDSAYLYIPAYTMLSSEKQSLWDQLFVKKKDVLEGIKEWAANSSNGIRLPPFRSTKLIERCNTCTPCKTWANEIFPNWKSSELKKEKLFCLITAHLLSYKSQFISIFGNEDLKKGCMEGYKNSQTFSFCDPATPEHLLDLVMGLLYGQMAYPSFPVMNKSLRLKYTAKDRQMFTDVFIFDKCRYLYDNFPSVHFSEFAMKELWQQMVYRMVADGLRKHVRYFAFHDVFRFCRVASINERIPGGTDFSDSCFYIPDREVLGDFAYLKENGNRLMKAGKFVSAIKYYTACQKMCPDDVNIYIGRALHFLQLNKLEEALDNCKKALELEPDNTWALYARNTIKIVKIFMKARDLEEQPARRELYDNMRLNGDLIADLISPQLRKFFAGRFFANSEACNIYK